MKREVQFNNDVPSWLARVLAVVVLLMFMSAWFTLPFLKRKKSPMMGNMKESVLIITALACSQPGRAPGGVVSVGLTSACIDPVAYGAIPDDGISDRVAIQDAVDAAVAAAQTAGPQRVCMGIGTWDCSRAPVGSYNRNACVSVHGGAVTIAGAGPGTVIRLAGDQNQADIVVISHDPDSSGGVQDLTVDTTDAFDTSEQTHAMGTTGVCSAPHCKPITNLSYLRVNCVSPARAGERKGDCIRLLGNVAPSADGQPGTGIYGVTIENSVFRDCARSGIQPQRGVHGLVIRNNEFWCDQPIHGEATGGSAPHENVDADITGNVFHETRWTGDAFQGDYDVALSGPPGSGPYENIRIHGNQGARGIYLYRTAGAELFDTALFATMRGAGGVLEVGNRCDGTRVHDVTIERRGAPGPVVRLISRPGALCSGVTVENTTLIQATQASGIYAESVSNLTVDRSLLVWTKPAPGPDYAGVHMRGTVAAVANMTVRSTWFSGQIDVAVRLAGAPAAIGTAHIIGNQARGHAALVCGGDLGLVEYTQNDFGSLSCSAVVP